MPLAGGGRAVCLIWTAIALSIQLPGLDGRPLAPLTPAGAANVLVFVATDCPVANGYAPEIQRLCAAAAANGVRCELIYEDVGATADDVRAHLAAFHYGAIAAGIDTDAGLAARVGVTVTPSAALVDHSGQVRYRGRIDNLYVALGRPRRVVTVHDLEDAIRAVVGGRPVALAETPAVGCAIVPGAMRGKQR